MRNVLEHLFQSRTRTAVLRSVLLDRWEGSVSELARRTGFSPRAVGAEVRNLVAAELLQVGSVGGADHVRARPASPVSTRLGALLRAAAEPPDATEERDTVRESLAALGAPLAGVTPVRHLAPHEALLAGLERARTDGTLLRVLPLVLARHAHTLDWVSLREEARRRKLKAEVGMLVELTATLLSRPALKEKVKELRDRRRRTLRFFPEARSRFERQLAQQRTPAAARAWGFLMNVSEESFRSTLERHGAKVQTARGEAHDLDAIEDVHRAHPLSLDTLVERFHETKGQVTGPASRFKLSFLAVVARLFGEREAERLDGVL